MSITQRFKKALKNDWCTQGLNAFPLFLNLAGWSGIIMKKKLGYGYNSFLLRYQNKYGEMNYLNSDFVRLWKIIKKKLASIPNYLQKVKNDYQKQFRQHYKTFAYLNNAKLQKFTDEQIIDILQQCSNAQIDSVGTAHIVESISIALEKEFKEALIKVTGQTQEFKNYYINLTTPITPSFIAQEEKELQKISKLPKDQKEKRINDHVAKYFWIQNSYAGPNNLDKSYFVKKSKILNKNNKEIIQITQKQKQDLIKKLQLSNHIKKQINIIEFVSTWQDERKEEILKTVSYLGKVVDEISRRTKISRETLYCLSVNEIFSIKSINDIVSLKKELMTRTKGVFFLMDSGKEYSISGKYFNEIDGVLKLKEKNSSLEREIYGSIANGGSAMGKVTICKSFASINKVQKGDILVASMTRPEFMPALKKAAAIVTDEGGITCHAAIVARELGIPAIIGTKIATKRLKDGMIVEIRANHGLVRIIS